MDKQTFLKELKQHLQVLEEREQQDILDEYAQHIDLKMRDGKSEEEAIKDFGSISELAAGILEAYHVNPNFQSSKMEQEAKKHVKNGKEIVIKTPDMEKVKEEGKKAASAAGDILRRLKDKVLHWIAVFQEKIKRRKPQDGESQPQESEQVKEKKAFWKQAKKGKATTFYAQGQRKGGIVRSVFKKLRDLCWNILIWIWNVCCTLAAALLAMFTAVSLFLFGVLLVCVFCGYPFLGLSIASLGAAMVMAAGTACLYGLKKNYKRMSDPIQRSKASGYLVDYQRES